MLDASSWAFTCVWASGGAGARVTTGARAPPTDDCHACSIMSAFARGVSKCSARWGCAEACPRWNAAYSSSTAVGVRVRPDACRNEARCALGASCSDRSCIASCICAPPALLVPFPWLASTLRSSSPRPPLPEGRAERSSPPPRLACLPLSIVAGKKTIHVAIGDPATGRQGRRSAVPPARLWPFSSVWPRRACA